MMSGCFVGVLLCDKVGDPLVSEPRKPQRHGVGALAAPAVERELENASHDIEFRQVPDVSNAIRDTPRLSPHLSNSPRPKTSEQQGVEAERLNAGNTALIVIDGLGTDLRRTDGTNNPLGFRNVNLSRAA